ncbi:hypothetical protein BJ546DRAFT_522909 [Cryomyces antarcticus]
MSPMTDGSHGPPLTLVLEPVRFSTQARGSTINSPDDYVYWVLLSRTTPFGVSDIEFLKLSQQETVALSLKATESWDPALRSLLEMQDPNQSSALPVCSALPNIAPWTPSARITLLGDATHVVSSAGGVGAVTSITDAALLAHTLCNEGVSVTSIGKYESAMRLYAAKSIERSYGLERRCSGSALSKTMHGRIFEG